MAWESSYPTLPFSFWTLFYTVTNAAPNIESIDLGGRGFTDAMPNLEHCKQKPNNTKVPWGKPCRNLKTVMVDDPVFTTPYLEYLAFKAPNLDHLGLRLAYRRVEELPKLRSTLEASLKKWSENLQEISIYGVLDGSLDKLITVCFPEMGKLKHMSLLEVWISAANLTKLRSLETLYVDYMNYEGIKAKLQISVTDRQAGLAYSPVLPKLTKFKWQYPAERIVPL